MITTNCRMNGRRAVPVLLLCLVGLVHSSVAQNTKVSWSTFSMGLTGSQTSNTLVKSLPGQNFVGTSLQATTQITSGFLVDTLFRAVSVAVREEEGLPLAYVLEQNYPNPFNPRTTIRYGIPVYSRVTIMVYNILGQQVAELVNGEVEAGFHEVQFEASNFSSGVYFYRIRAGEYVQTKKLLLLK